MTTWSLGLTLGVLVFVLQYNGYQAKLRHHANSPKNKQCGCAYNIYANMPLEQRLKKACSVDCVFSQISGQCNNRCHMERGQSIRPFGRLLLPDYCGPAIPSNEGTRCAKSGRPLPNARTLSLQLFQDKPLRFMDRFLTSAHMAFGQFLSHDFGRKNEPKHTDDKGINLCGKNQCKENAACTPVHVFSGDPDFVPVTENNGQCLRFQRSTRNNSPDHKFREQQNDVSSYLDLNTVYGTTEEETRLLRDPRPQFRAYLNTTSLKVLGLPGRLGKPILPQKNAGTCRGQTTTVRCFMSGDKRAKEQPQLTVYHIVMVREHNRLVYNLNKINGGCWSQERLFQEARKINIAQWQSMIYREYLPLLFSNTNMLKWNLKLNDGFGFTSYYDKKLNGTVSNVFMSASFRFGHTQIPIFVPLALPSFEIYRNLTFSEVFNNPTLIYFPKNPVVTGVDALAFGMIALSAEAYDAFFNKEITRSFDAPAKGVPARDLETMDIMRGRDHALPGYLEWRRFCGLVPDLRDIPTGFQQKLSELYEDIEDIDIFVGAQLETPWAGDLAGPLFTCLNAEQFRRSRLADRFWHEEKANGFSREQLASIRTVTSGRYMCNNLDDAVIMQPFILAHPRSKAEALFGDVTSPWDFNLVYGEKLKSNNERVPCSSLPQLNLDLWKEDGCWNPSCNRGYPKSKNK